MVGLRPDFNETRQPVRGHELWNQVFIILQTEKTRLGDRSSRCYRDGAPAAEAVTLQLVFNTEVRPSFPEVSLQGSGSSQVTTARTDRRMKQHINMSTVNLKNFRPFTVYVLTFRVCRFTDMAHVTFVLYVFILSLPMD